jgi:primosomal protein N' (replication factor Y) (superfamily II helicase)
MSNTAAKSSNSASHSILSVAVSLPVFRLFDYLPPTGVCTDNLIPGVRLEVPFGKTKIIAYLIELKEESQLEPDKLKPALRIVDAAPLLHGYDLQLLHWASRYYHHPLGEVFKAAFPANLRKGMSAALPEAKQSAYKLTALGELIDLDTLSRSPKQSRLILAFRQHYPGILNTSDLRALDKNWRAAVTSLIGKCLLEKCASEAVAAREISESDVAEIEQPENNNRNSILLNNQQQTAVATVTAALNQFAVFLLNGITGSGKTEVYLHLIQEALSRDRQVLVLVPEINLTPQLEQRFSQRFPGKICLFHSGLTANQRQNAWVNIQQGVRKILIGTRSALFTPMHNIGLIILDEEHDTSFKQQEGFRFSARDTAIMRGKISGIPVLLGSATPSLESLYNARQQRYHELVLSERAGAATPPMLRLLDIRNKKLDSGLSAPLLAEIGKTLAQHEQVLLFLNRRGFAPTLICHGCGWVARCRSCDANLVIHSRDRCLRCHHCGKEQAIPASCPACAAKELVPAGLGTERIEQTLHGLFPGTRLVRLDRDSTRQKGSLEKYLEEINRGEAELILGTQMLAKGHHFPNVTLVAIIDVDSGLFGIDYRSSERLAQLIVQISGRAGRAAKPGQVILQTRHPDHPLLKTLISNGYRQFANSILAERQAANLPPFSYQAVLRAQASKPETVLAFLQNVMALLNLKKYPHLLMLGPVSAPMEKRAGAYRYQVLFQSNNRAHLQKILDEMAGNIDSLATVKKVRWSLDVDPVDLF